MRTSRGVAFVIVLTLVVQSLLGILPIPHADARAAQVVPVLAFVPPGLIEVEQGSRSLEQIAAGFPAPAEAAALLAAWGWMSNVYYNFAGRTAAGTTSLEVSFHFFRSAAGATEAMSYYAAGRALMLGLDPVPMHRIGDQVLAIGGVRDVGNEVTVYVRSDAVLVRVSAVAPRGDPALDAATTAGNILAYLDGSMAAPVSTPDLLLPALSDLPPGFVVTADGWRSLSEIADTFLRPGEASQVLSSCGFQINRYRYFGAPAGRSPLVSGTTSIEVSLHVFATRNGARCALPYYADGRAEALGLRLLGFVPAGDGMMVLQGRAPDGVSIETTVYLLIGNVLARISVASPSGDPTADALGIAFIIAAWA